ncbi:MAG: esterase [Actinomycetota bacterium]|nr:esterase [Actinomycetota bacterium]
MPSAQAATADAPPVVTNDSVSWRLPAGSIDGAVTGVDLDVHATISSPMDFTADATGGWTLQLPRPLAHRFEYQLRVHRPAGDEHITDPTNPRTVPGPFGDRSEILFPDYQPPAWLGTEATGSTVQVTDPAGPLAVPVPIQLFSPTGLADDTPAPLLIAHDGSDMADRGSLLSWACAQHPPIRVALLDPPIGYRNPWYAADPAYADHIGGTVIPALKERVATSATAGLGASLGAVAMMTIHRRHPESLDALALQSGSFFTGVLDQQEESWPQFAGVCAAVAAMTDALPAQVRGVPVLMTVGAIEENRANNELMAGALTFQGYHVNATIVPDAHTMIGWRDAWSPGLDELMRLIGQSRE